MKTPQQHAIEYQKGIGDGKVYRDILAAYVAGYLQAKKDTEPVKEPPVTLIVAVIIAVLVLIN